MEITLTNNVETNLTNNFETNLTNNVETNLTNKLILWYHHDKDNWSINGYKKIFELITIKDFWSLHNNWDKLGGITSKHIFLMKENITPLWEDKNNIAGGCWSFKVTEDLSEELFEDLSTLLVCNELCSSISNEIVGLSLCLKKNNNVVIKIWNKNSKNNSLKLINENIIKKWGMDIIYIAHMPDSN
jgi:hypothetical protein